MSPPYPLTHRPHHTNYLSRIHSFSLLSVHTATVGTLGAHCTAALFHCIQGIHFNAVMSRLFHKRPCGCRFLFQAIKSTPDSICQLLGYNKHLQPHRLSDLYVELHRAVIFKINLLIIFPINRCLICKKIKSNFSDPEVTCPDVLFCPTDRQKPKDILFTTIQTEENIKFSHLRSWAHAENIWHLINRHSYRWSK